MVRKLMELVGTEVEQLKENLVINPLNQNGRNLIDVGKIQAYRELPKWIAEAQKLTEQGNR